VATDGAACHAVAPAPLAGAADRNERVRRREFPVITRLTQIGRLLIALRIAQGLTQRELAERLGISESLVSRDERNEYHGITVERAQRVLDALGETVTTRVAEPASRERERELAGAACGENPSAQRVGIEQRERHDQISP